MHPAPTAPEIAARPGHKYCISSTAKLRSLWLVPYGGTEAFLIALGNALSLEMRADLYEIEVLGIVVDVMASAGVQVPESLSVPSAQTIVSVSLDHVGCGRLST